jgi:hypothetical protein
MCVTYLFTFHITFHISRTRPTLHDAVPKSTIIKKAELLCTTTATDNDDVEVFMFLQAELAELKDRTIDRSIYVYEQVADGAIIRWKDEGSCASEYKGGRVEAGRIVLWVRELVTARVLEPYYIFLTIRA